MAGKDRRAQRRGPRRRLSTRYLRQLHLIDLPARMHPDDLLLVELEHDYGEDCCERDRWRPEPHALADERPPIERAYAAIERRLLTARPFNPLRGLGIPAVAREHERAPQPDMHARVVEHLCKLDEHSADAMLDDADAARDLWVLADLCDDRIDHALAVALLLFRPFWLRSLQSWKPGSPLELVEHLLVAYPYPRFLLNAWRGALGIRWLAWMIVSCQGGSLRRLTQLAIEHGAPGRWPKLAKKLPAALLDVPDHVSPATGLMLAELMRLGGSVIELRRLRLERRFVCDPTLLPPAELEFWHASVRWLIRYREQLDNAACRQILAWAFDFKRGRGHFDWSGRTPAAAGEEARRHHEQRKLSRYAGRFWPVLGLAWSEIIDGTAWTIQELSDGDALLFESLRMHHCVHSYVAACERRRCAIVSLSRAGKPVLTIELSLPDRLPKQIRGACNRSATPEERRVIDRWQRSCHDIVLGNLELRRSA